MSATIPFELNGTEFIAEAVSSRNTSTNHVEYFIKINGDPACFANYEYVDNSLVREESSSADLTTEFKEALRKALINYLASTVEK